MQDYGETLTRAPLSSDDTHFAATTDDRGRRILIIDDDEGTRQTFAIALRLIGFTVVTVESGLQAIDAVTQSHFDLMLVDLRLRDMSGIDLVRSLREAERPPFVMISAFLSTEKTVEAMRLGAITVIEKPVAVEELMTLASDLAARSPADDAAAERPPHRTPRSAAERWAWHVLQGCTAPTDLKTLEAWSHHCAVSYSTLCTACRIMDIRPLDARDFMRVLRALQRAIPRGCPPEALLDIGDARTVQLLSARAGIDLTRPAAPASLDSFLDRQHFVAARNEGLHLIRDTLRHAPATAARRVRGAQP